MLYQILKGKIHRARVTAHDLDYEGSLTLDRGLMDAAGLVPYEKIAVFNVTNGNRFETYVIEGEEGTGAVCINGAAAHLARTGDIIIIAAYGLVDTADPHAYKPRLVYVDEHNQPVDHRKEQE